MSLLESKAHHRGRVPVTSNHEPLGVRMANKRFSGVLYEEWCAFRRIRLGLDSPDIVFAAGRSAPAGYAQPQRGAAAFSRRKLDQLNQMVEKWPRHV
jgi:hypothetical protein